MKITMREVPAGEGWNDVPELRVKIQSNDIMDLPRVIAALTPGQRELFDQYGKQTDFEPFFGPQDGFRFNEERTFIAEGES